MTYFNFCFLSFLLLADYQPMNILNCLYEFLSYFLPFIQCKSISRYNNASWLCVMAYRLFLVINCQHFKYTHTSTHIHRQICFVLSELFSVAWQARFPKLWPKLSWLKRQSKILPLSHEETSASEGNLNIYVSQFFLFTYIRLTATETSIHMKSLALR